jgi:hypothetical protein
MRLPHSCSASGGELERNGQLDVRGCFLGVGPPSGLVVRRAQGRARLVCDYVRLLRHPPWSACCQLKSKNHEHSLYIAECRRSRRGSRLSCLRGALRWPTTGAAPGLSAVWTGCIGTGKGAGATGSWQGAPVVGNARWSLSVPVPCAQDGIVSGRLRP